MPSPSWAFLRSAISTYLGLSSIPIDLRPSPVATFIVVPDPANGSSTVQGTGSAAGQVQEGDQPVVVAFGGEGIVPLERVRPLE